MTTPSISRRKPRGRVVYLRRSHIVVNPPQATKEARANSPVITSIGALADFPLWDEFQAEIEANREEQNWRVADED